MRGIKREKSVAQVIERVASLAVQLGGRPLADYGATRSRHDFTQRQLMACLILRAYLKTKYRGLLELLAVSPNLQEALGLADKLPHYTTLQKFSARSQVLAIADAMIRTIGRAAGAPKFAQRAAAMDATGLETTTANAYFQSRSGRTRRKWVKVSTIVLCGSVLPLSLVLDWGPGNDNCQPQELMAKAGETTLLAKLYADAGCDAEWVHDQCRLDWGMESLIKPARQRADGTRSGFWRSRMSENYLAVLLTECAKCDPDIVGKIKAQLVAGKSVVITSGLLRALQRQGIEDIVEARYTDRKILAHQYLSSFCAGNGTAIGDKHASDVLFPEIDFLTYDSWALVRALASGCGYPLLLMDRYSKGILYVWTIPDNFNDLYRLPLKATNALKNDVMGGFPVRVDGPAQVALFAFDHDTFIVESYPPVESDVKITVTGRSVKLQNLVTGEILAGLPQPQGFRRQPGSQEAETAFSAHLLPHSYGVFAFEE
jgi:hypothetical protein